MRTSLRPWLACWVRLSEPIKTTLTALPAFLVGLGEGPASVGVSAGIWSVRRRFSFSVESTDFTYSAEAPMMPSATRRRPP